MLTLDKAVAKAEHEPTGSPTFPVRLVTVGMVGIVLVVIASAAATWTTGRKIKAITEGQVAVMIATEQLQRYGDVLELSARLAVITGEARYANQYRNTQPQLIKALHGLRKTVQLSQNKLTARAVNEADTELVRAEYRALDLAKAGRLAEAQRV